MRPILNTSTQWTALPSELIEQIREEFFKQNQILMTNRIIFVEGRIYAEEIQLRLGTRVKNEITQHNFESAVLYDNKDNIEEKINKCIDMSSNLLREFLQDDLETENLPRQWKRLEDIWVQYSTTNTELEQQADALLNEAQDSHLVNAVPNEDALDSAFFFKDAETVKEVGKKFRQN